jgi:hypothetical protein
LVTRKSCSGSNCQTVEFRTKSIPKIKPRGARAIKVNPNIGAKPIISPGRMLRIILEHLIIKIVRIEKIANRKYHRERFLSEDILELDIILPSLLPIPTHRSQTKSKIPRQSSFP